MSPTSELWIVCAIVFAGVVLAVQALYRMVARAQSDRNTIKRRLTESAGDGVRRTSVEILRQERGLANFNHPRLAALNEFLTQTGLRISVLTLGLSTLSLSALVALALSLILFHLWMAVAIGLIAGSLSVVAYLEAVRRRRIDAFTAQLPDALNIIVRSLRIGHPLVSAIGLASREMRDPIAAELAMTAEEIAFGQDVTTAAVNLHARVGQDDLLFFVTAVSVQSQTGGNLAEVLARLATLMRQRSTLQLKVKALSAEGRLSAWFLSAMPFILYGAVRLLSKDYFAELTASPALVPALVYAAVSLVVANFVIHRMVNFRI
ncbi:MAG: type II secretion system F family protein [Roseiarcus sp.]